MRPRRSFGLLRRIIAHRAALAGIAIVLLYVSVAIFANAIAPYQVGEVDLLHVLEPPSRLHPWGTDELGRDIFSRVVMGSRISFAIGLSALAIGLGVGVPLGSLAAFYSGRVSDLILGLANVLLTFPTIILAITIVSVIGTGLSGVIIAAGIAMVPGKIRLTNASVLSVRNTDYVVAARTIGCSDARIIARHLLPNALSPLIVSATLSFGGTILTAAGLGFLGLGVQPPAPEWGTMLNGARAFLLTASHMAIFPGLVVGLLVLGFNLLGDGLRDLLDPTMRNP
jgi:peptide/nickel transport system permease protein